MTSRVIIFSGKGGTGKTTISAATASVLAQQGKRVLIISTDPAHSLGDVVDQPISRTQPTQLAPRLYGLELDTRYEANRSMSGLQNHMETSYRKQGVAAPVASELAGQPGLDEILSLHRLLEESESGHWDVVILDTAPTGNTLRLLAYPELLIGGNGVARAMKAYKGLAKAFKGNGSEGATERYFGEVNRLLEIMHKLNRFLVSKELTIRLVMNAEKLSLEETKRAYTFLSLYGIPLDAVMINKLYPKDAGDVMALLALDQVPDTTAGDPDSTELGSYFDKWVALQQHYTREIENSFAPLPILKTYLQRNEPLGVARLAELGALVYRELDPAARLYQQTLIWLEDEKAKTKKADSGSHIHRTLCLRLPFFVEESDQAFEVDRDGPEISINFGRIQRRVSLPRILNEAEYVQGVYRDGVLRLGFSEAKKTKTAVTTIAAYEEDDPFRVN